MARVKFEDGTVINFNGEPKPQDIEEAYNQVKGVSTQQPTQGQPQEVPQEQVSPLEQKISERPNIYRQAVEAIQNRFSPEGLTQPVTIPQDIDIVMKSLGGVAQRGEAMIANPFLETARIDRTLPQRMLQGVTKGFTGERLGEIGDVGRMAGLPEPVSATLGLIGSAMTGDMFSKMVGLTSKADSLAKIQTTYGFDAGRNVIRHTTGLPMPLVERGMKRGWRNILTKANAKEIDLPTKVSSYVLNSLDDITKNEYDEFGKVLNRVKTGKIKAIDLNQVVEDTLKINGYIDDTYRPTLKTRGAVVNKIQGFIDTAQRNKVKPDTDIPIDIVQALKNTLKKFVPEKNWIGKSRSLSGEQKLAKDLSNKLDDLVAYNAYGIEDEAYTQAKRRYSEFKNFEKVILDSFSEVVGQEVKPTADKVMSLPKLNPTAMTEEMNKLGYIDDFLKSKGHNGISDKLLDWMTTQELLLKPENSFFRETVRAPVKYGMRQTLQSGATAPLGRGIEKAGKFIQPSRSYINRQTAIPPSILSIIRGFSGRNETQ